MQELIKNIIGSGTSGSGTTTLKITRKEMKDIMKTVKSLEDFGQLVIGVSETMETETKEQISGLFGMLLGILEAYWDIN